MKSSVNDALQEVRRLLEEQANLKKETKGNRTKRIEDGKLIEQHILTLCNQIQTEQKSYNELAQEERHYKTLEKGDYREYKKRGPVIQPKMTLFGSNSDLA